MKPTEIKSSEITDAELDQLLALASQPQRPLGAESRLLKRISIVEPRVVGNEVSTVKWLAALPLAASLACGIYLGSAGYGSAFGIADTDVVASIDASAPTGLEEAEAAAEEDVL